MDKLSGELGELDSEYVTIDRDCFVASCFNCSDLRRHSSTRSYYLKSTTATSNQSIDRGPIESQVVKMVKSKEEVISDFNGERLEGCCSWIASNIHLPPEYVNMTADVRSCDSKRRCNLSDESMTSITCILRLSRNSRNGSNRTSQSLQDGPRKAQTGRRSAMNPARR